MPPDSPGSSEASLLVAFATRWVRCKRNKRIAVHTALAPMGRKAPAWRCIQHCPEFGRSSLRNAFRTEGLLGGCFGTRRFHALTAILGG